MLQYPGDRHSIETLSAVFFFIFSFASYLAWYLRHFRLFSYSDFRLFSHPHNLSLSTDVPPPLGKIPIFPEGEGTSVHRLHNLPEPGTD